MKGSSRREEVCPQLLDLIHQNREWLINREKERSHGSSEEKKLELRLGPPGQDWPLKENKQRDNDQSLLSLGYFSPMASSGTQKTNNNINNSGNQNQPHKFSSSENGVGNVLSSSSSPWSSSTSSSPSGYQGKAPTSFLQSLPVMGKEASQPCCPKVVDLQKNAEKKAFSSSTPANTAVPNSSQKRYFGFFLFLFIFSLVSIFIFWTEDIHSKQDHVLYGIVLCGPCIIFFIPVRVKYLIIHIYIYVCIYFFILFLYLFFLRKCQIFFDPF